VKATWVSKDAQVCGSPRRKLLAAGLVAGLVAALSGMPATAGTSANAEITDVAGDGNFINGQGAQSGHEVGPDTRPVSSNNVDLRAVWFETAYTTSKVLDPASGAVLRVEHRPTALVIHAQTQGPARPMTPWSTINYKVSATLPGCKALFELDVFSTPPDRAIIWPLEGTRCDTDAAFARSPIAPTFDGTVSTMTFPLANPLISKYISSGTAIRQPEADAFGHLPSIGNGGLRVDETVTGRDFTIGQDVPPGIDCSAEPSNSECQS
jgi:hypothetical protein